MKSIYISASITNGNTAIEIRNFLSEKLRAKEDFEDDVPC